MQVRWLLRDETTKAERRPNNCLYSIDSMILRYFVSRCYGCIDSAGRNSRSNMYRHPAQQTPRRPLHDNVAGAALPRHILGRIDP